MISLASPTYLSEYVILLGAALYVATYVYLLEVTRTSTPRRAYDQLMTPARSPPPAHLAATSVLPATSSHRQELHRVLRFVSHQTAWCTPYTPEFVNNIYNWMLKTISPARFDLSVPGPAIYNIFNPVITRNITRYCLLSNYDFTTFTATIAIDLSRKSR